MDRTHKFRLCVLVCTAALIVAIGVFYLGTISAGRYYFLIMGAGLFGAAGFPLVASGLELGVECTHPLSEGISSGVLWFSGFVITTIMQPLAELLRASDGSMARALYLIGALQALAFLLMCLFRGKNKRQMALKKRHDPSGQELMTHQN